MPLVSETRGRQGVWLLEMVIGGEAFRFATQPITIIDRDGLAYEFAPGLAEFAWSYAGPAIAASVGVTVRSDVDWAQMTARAIPIERAPAVLRRVFPDQILEDALIIVDGLIIQAEYGATDEALTITVAARPIEQSEIIPGALQRVDASTWPVSLDSFDDGIEGAAYPIVIGSPGNVGSGTPQPAVPALMVDYRAATQTSKVMIAGHVVDASSVTLWDLTETPASESRPVATTPDLLGRTVSHVDFVAATFTSAADREWYTGWADTARGILSDDRSAGIRGAGEVARVLLDRFTSIKVDRGRMKAEGDRLDEYKIDTYINAPARVYDWVAKHIRDALPVLELRSNEGLYLRHLDWRATRTDVIAHLDADGAALERVSPVRTMAEPIANEITVEFRRQAGSSRYGARRIITARPGQLQQVDPSLTFADDTRIFGDLRCLQSQSLFGLKPALIRLPQVWDAATALMIGMDCAARKALPKRVTDYEGGPELEALEPGQVVSVTDSEIHWQDLIGIVWDVQIGQGPRVTVTVVLVDNPIQNARQTG